MTNEDFLLFCLNLYDFLSGELEQLSGLVKYPVGIIHTNKGSVKLHFMHYPSFEEAKESWDIRKKRVDYNNIRVILNAEANVNQATTEKFRKIPYKKILLTSNCTEKDDCINMQCFQSGYRGPLVAYKSKKIPFLRYMDEVNWIEFLND